MVGATTSTQLRGRKNAGNLAVHVGYWQLDQLEHSCSDKDWEFPVGDLIVDLLHGDLQFVH